MDKWKAVFWKLLFPGTIWIFLLFNASAILLFCAFAVESCPAAIAYFSYVLSAYTLTVVCARMPAIIKRAKKRVYKNKYANRYFTEKELRIRVSLYGGLLLNICFALFKVVMGILYQSKWLFAMAGYHTILSSMRFLLVYRDQNNQKEETDQERWLWGLHSYHVCGWLMLLLNIAISVIVVIVVLDKQAITYPGFMIYAIAAYTFYCLTMAIINMKRYWKRHNPVFSAVKRIEMAKALVSLFTLQVAMLTQFGVAEALENRLANTATGSVVCVVITVMAVLMLTGVKKDYQKIKSDPS